MNIKLFSKQKHKIKPTTEELIERGFAPQNGKIDILFINPPSTLSERYGRKDLKGGTALIKGFL